MITFYTGTPGSGKSYHLARKIFDMMRFNKQNIIANFDINMDNVKYTWLGWLKHRITEVTKDKVTFKNYNQCKLKGYFEYWQNTEITPEHLLDFAQRHHKKRKEGQTLVIIDEAGIFYNCRTFATGNRPQWTDFFAKHRHYGFDFILACQFDRQVDKQIRMCVEYEIVHRKLKNYQFLGWLMATLSGGNIFIAKEYWYASRDKLQNSMSIMRFSTRISSLYDTYADFSRDGFGSSAGGVRGPTRGAAVPAPEIATQDVDAAALIWAAALTNMCYKTDEERGEGNNDTSNYATQQVVTPAGADTAGSDIGACDVTA